MTEAGEGQIVGALIGVLEQQIFSEALTACVIHFDVLPEARMGSYGVRLLKAFERWATNRKVIEIGFGVNSGEHLEQLSRLALRTSHVAWAT
ncbi:MAG: hypothetical protein C0505_17485 [Leptothrix sp. (in: Bacteria)]|nr:hypothetical protein [Leptothrix sp. (in: b-proteobacteria)]